MPDQHSTVVGGSTAQRVRNCPASVGLAAKLPPKPAGPAAIRGTALHTVMERHFEEDTDLSAFEGITFDTKDGPYTVTADDVGQCRLAVKALDKLLAQTGAVNFDLEVRVEYGGDIPQAFGTVDFLGWNGKWIILADWKFGYNPVTAENNEQLLFYAGALRRTRPELFNGKRKIMLAIIQPAKED